MRPPPGHRRRLGRRLRQQHRQDHEEPGRGPPGPHGRPTQVLQLYGHRRVRQRGHVQPRGDGGAVQHHQEVHGPGAGAGFPDGR